jgi:hypothetical protein
MYLCSLGHVLYRSTAGLVINAGPTFKPGTLATYDYNYKSCEIVVFLILTASYVTLPKITQWMASTSSQDQDRVRFEMRRINQFQSLMGCGAALAYLAGNSLFLKIWWYHSAHPILPVALTLQTVFALNLAVTTSADAGIQLGLRAGSKGLRTVGLAIGLSGLLNLGLALFAKGQGSLVWIAMATVMSQSALSLVASGFTCRHLGVNWPSWAAKSWLAPLALILAAGWLRIHLPFDSTAHVVILLAAYAAMFLLMAGILGVGPAFVRDELKILRSFAGPRK